MTTNLPVLAGVDLGKKFRAMVNKIAWKVPRHRGRITVLLDDLPDSSARLDLVRLAVIVALERNAKSVQVLPITACDWNGGQSEWFISRTEPARGFTFANGQEQSGERTVTLAESGDRIVRVAINGKSVKVRPPSEVECRRLLESGALGTQLRFPVFPSSGPSMLARGAGPRELVLWRCGLATTTFRLPGPVLAATHVAETSTESLIALIEADGELVVHAEGYPADGLRRLHVPIDFSVADEAERDLSPLYLDMDEPWQFSTYFRRAGTWWRLRWDHGTISLTASTSAVHRPGSFPFHTKHWGAPDVLLGPGHTYAAANGPTWKTWGTEWDDTVIPVPPDEDVLGLTKIEGEPALLTREGGVLRARTSENGRTVVDFAGPVIPHHELPWVAVQRSAHLVEVLDVATSAVLHRVGTAGAIR
ncbi:hypothetical protein ACIA8G_28445 [Lentzea sp. NPDC051213]|uniref:hypothetical protein n=1 Tax=Lentzea sp. NPDC051213 TaxID=3364126 RepID=UPI00379CB163